MKRLVDLYDENGELFDTYKVNLTGLSYDPPDREFEAAALRSAIEDGLVPADEKRNWTARVRGHHDSMRDAHLCNRTMDAALHLDHAAMLSSCLGCEVP